jgi:V/A-type H+-transporting ATPase subunit K
MKKKFLLLFLMLSGTFLLAGLSSLLLWHPQALAATDSALHGMPRDGGIWQWGYLAAALATGMSSIGAAIAVAAVGSAAIGALAEKPELFGRLLILIGLAEGIAIYGLIISVVIINNLAA